VLSQSNSIDIITVYSMIEERAEMFSRWNCIKRVLNPRLTDVFVRAA
jgi:hypothetical protein